MQPLQYSLAKWGFPKVGVRGSSPCRAPKQRGPSPHSTMPLAASRARSELMSGTLTPQKIIPRGLWGTRLLLQKLPVLEALRRSLLSMRRQCAAANARLVPAMPPAACELLAADAQCSAVVAGHYQQSSGTLGVCVFIAAQWGQEQPFAKSVLMTDEFRCYGRRDFTAWLNNVLPFHSGGRPRPGNRDPPQEVSTRSRWALVGFASDDECSPQLLAEWRHCQLCSRLEPAAPMGKTEDGFLTDWFSLCSRRFKDDRLHDFTIAGAAPSASRSALVLLMRILKRKAREANVGSVYHQTNPLDDLGHGVGDLLELVDRPPSTTKRTLFTGL